MRKKKLLALIAIEVVRLAVSRARSGSVTLSRADARVERQHAAAFEQDLTAAPRSLRVGRRSQERRRGGERAGG